MRADVPDRSAHRHTVASNSAVSVLASLVRQLAGAPTIAEQLRHALEIAVEAVPGCEQAGITIVRPKEGIESPASLGDLAVHCDRLQEELGEGPCVTSSAEAETIRVDDLERDGRWPSFAAAAAGIGVRSMLSCQLATPRDRLGALNLYSTKVHSFPDDAEHIATAYATHVGILLAATEKERNLQVALRTREVIGQAMGILMERHRVTATQAFDLMVHTSQRSHVKLRALAEELVRTGELPG
jgi:hypothetical protein